MKITKFTFIGTTEEFRAIEHHFSEEPNGTINNVSIQSKTILKGQNETSVRTEAISSNSLVEDIKRVLTRIRIPRGQKQLYKALYDASEKGLSATDLASQMNRKGDLPGILGALGGRINYTPGIEGKPGVELLFNMEQREGVWHYTMKPELRQTLENLNPPPDWLDNMIP